MSIRTFVRIFKSIPDAYVRALNVLALLFALLFGLALPGEANALNLRQQVIEEKGAIKIQNIVDCRADETMCQNLCGHSSCGWTEPVCRDCFGTGDNTMREVFQTLIPTYRAAEPLDERVVVYRLLTRSAVLVANHGVYDFYNNSTDPGFSEHLLALCGSREGFISVLLDRDSRPTKAFMAICSTPKGLASRQLLLAEDEELEPQDNQPLKLKLDYGCRLQANQVCGDRPLNFNPNAKP